MAASIFIARLLGPVLILIGLALLLRGEAFREILREFLASKALHYLAGVLGLLGGLALVLTHNVWTADWRVIITLIGWLAIVRAIVTIFWPDHLVALGNAMLRSRKAFPVSATIDILLGLVLCYYAYPG